MATQKQLMALAKMREAKKQRYIATKHCKSDYEIVNSYFYFMWNKWDESTCHKVWKGFMGDHFWNKWDGDAEHFWSILSDPNRDILMNYIAQYYK